MLLNFHFVYGQFLSNYNWLPKINSLFSNPLKPLRFDNMFLQNPTEHKYADTQYKNLYLYTK